MSPAVENQFEVGVTHPFRQSVQVGVTGYYRRGDNEVHTTVWPDARVYSYASFDHSRAYGLETRFDAPLVRRLGLTAYFNYALGRVYFYGPVTGGFIVEPHHIEETGRFFAPMDQTHTLTSGLTYRPMKRQSWVSLALECGSGTPLEAEEDESGAQVEQAMAAEGQRVPGHLTANLSMGADIWHDSEGKRGLAVRISIENVTNKIYKVAQESVFTPGQYSIPRLISGGVTVRFRRWEYHIFSEPRVFKPGMTRAR